MLSQLSNPTFFSINIFMPDHWGTSAVTVVMGLIFVASFLLLHYFFGINLKKSASLLVLVAACYLPFGASFLMNSSKTVSADWSRLDKSPQENIVQSFCQMDDTQHMGGLYCALAQYMSEAIKFVPAGTKLRLAFNSSLSFYANYYFYGSYQIVNDYSQADYLLVFLSEQKYTFSKAGELLIEQDGKEVSLGKWQSVVTYNPEIMILKRL